MACILSFTSVAFLESVMSDFRLRAHGSGSVLDLLWLRYGPFGSHVDAIDKDPTKIGADMEIGFLLRTGNLFI